MRSVCKISKTKTDNLEVRTLNKKKVKCESIELRYHTLKYWEALFLLYVVPFFQVSFYAYFLNSRNKILALKNHWVVHFSMFYRMHLKIEKWWSKINTISLLYHISKNIFVLFKIQVRDKENVPITLSDSVFTLFYF